MKGIKELIKYGIFGCLSTSFNLILFYLFVEIGINYLVSNIVSYVLAVILSYFFNNKFVFENINNKSNYKKFIKFFIIRISSIVLDTGLLAFFVSFLCFDIFLSKIFISISLIILTYIFNKIFVFNS